MGSRVWWVLPALIVVGLGAGWGLHIRSGGSWEDVYATARNLVRTTPAPAATPERQNAGGDRRAAIVETTPVRVGESVRTVTAVGSLVSNESVVIRPEVAGRVAEISFQEGARVTRGTPLIKLDDAVARANLAQAQANLAYSRTDSQRADELFRQGTGAAKTREQAVAKYQSDEASVQLYKAQLDRMTLLAPFDGVVGLKLVSVGDMVTVGKDLVNLEQIDTLKLDFRVPEMYLPAVKVGQKLTLAVDAFDGRTFEGEVYAIDPLIDVNGRALKIRARIPNGDGTLRPGLFARVALTLTVVPDAMMVPEQAVATQGRDTIVFTVADGKAKAVKVQLGERRGGEVRVVSGLKPDDHVVVAGQARLRDGVAVRVADPGAPSGERKGKQR